MINITLPITPTAQQRPRFAKRGNFVSAYKSAEQQANERTLEALLYKHAPKEAIAAPVRLEVLAVMPIPQSTPKRLLRAMQSETLAHTKKPDLDNIVKQLKDALSRLRFWHDDKQVAEMICKKVYGVNPRWEITIMELI